MKRSVFFVGLVLLFAQCSLYSPDPLQPTTPESTPNVPTAAPLPAQPYRAGFTPTPAVVRTPQSPPTPAGGDISPPTPPVGDISSKTAALRGAQTWVYQLSDYQGNKLDVITQNPFDLAVIDLARDGDHNFFTAAEINRLKASGKLVLAYFVIGSIEDYRSERKLVEQQMPDIILKRVKGWPHERYVKYWDPRWWPIVQGRIEQAVSAGFDGAYLDLIFAYEDIKPESVGLERVTLAHEMINLIERISRYAKSKDPNFLIMPQNNPELYTNFDQRHGWGQYLAAIDGFAIENLYYLDTGNPCTADWCEENMHNAQGILKAGKPVFSIDYTADPKHIRDVYEQAKAAGFIPYVSAVGLPTCYLSGLSPLTPCP